MVVAASSHVSEVVAEATREFLTRSMTVCSSRMPEVPSK